MTMADNLMSSLSPTAHQEIYEHHDALASRSDPKKRKRKRLSAVLDKLHNNTNMMHHNIGSNTNFNNNNTSSINSNINNNHESVINNNVLMASTKTDIENKMAYSTNLARSVQENAEILRNLFALSQGLPHIHPAFPFIPNAPSSPTTALFECNNNNNNSNNNNNNETTVTAKMADKMLLNGKVKIEVKEETIDGEDTIENVRDTCKTPLQQFLQLPKTTVHNNNNNNNNTVYGHNHQKPLYQYQNGYTFNNDPQEYPLDLSMKNVKRRKSSSASSSASSPSLTKQLLIQQTEQKINAVLQPLGIQVPKDCSISIQTTPGSESMSPHQLPQYYQDLKVSPIVEEVAPGTNSCYVCPICGQMFSLNDRLAKHIASRHKTRSPASESSPAKCYVCEVCNRSFARSDMLTRHMRLHTGIKPYNCNTCGQVFSRSDHLSTHQRTHTGEKPYRCPQCNYAACRRDMITRHMRTHARYEQNNGAQPPRRAMKVKTEKVKTEVKTEDATKLIGNNLNNNDISMFNQNSLENINELRMKLQENFLANSGLMPSDIPNLKREIKIEF